MSTISRTAPSYANDDGRSDEGIDDLVARRAGCRDDAERRRLEQDVIVRGIAVADGVARRYSRRGVDPEDLEQVARAALVTALHRYDPAVGSGFLTYAFPTIYGELKKYFRDHAWAIRPPRRLQELRLDLVRTEDRLRHELRREPTTVEVADELGVTVAVVGEVRCLSSAYRASSLDSPGPTGGVLGETLAVAEDATAGVDDHWTLAGAVQDLTGRERLLLRLRFEEELTQREIGAALGVSQVQVSRLLSTTLARLRRSLRVDELRLGPDGVGA